MTVIKNMICELNSPINECIKYIKSNPVKDMPSGKYSVSKNGIFVILQEYKTRSVEEANWESHKKYVDFQYIISGAENVFVSMLSDMKQGEYDGNNDYLVCYGNSSEEITICAGNGIVLMPEDVHMPCLHCNGKPTSIRKAVFKIPVECFE